MKEERMFVFEDGTFKEVTEDKSSSNAEDVTGQAMAQAEYLSVKNDEGVQGEIVEGAKKVVRNRTIEMTAESERKAKEALFKNNKSACECFGYSEASTEKWAVTAMGVWHNVITAIWIVLGMLTFAPVTFIARKLSVIIKTTWIAVTVAVGIYIFVATSPFWIKLLALINGALG